MSHPKLAGALLLFASVAALACQSTQGPVPEFEDPVDAATHAYQDYERGDCARVGQRADSERIRKWDSTEVRHAMVLIRGFCQERAGNLDAARATYRELIQDAPLSFASDDARERLRVLRLTERDPDYKAWVEGAKARHSKRGTDRVPIDRIPADFPPLAHEADIEGYAIVEFGITPRGDTDSPVIVESMPPLLFDGAALRAVREWRYTRDLESTKSQRQVIRIVFRPADAETTLDESESIDQAPSDERETSVQ